MQRIRKRLVNIALLFVAALLLASCATGRIYQKVDKIPEGMGLVYIYRPGSIVGSGNSPGIVANGVLVINRVVNGGYYPYFSRSGEVKFEFENRRLYVHPEPVILHIEAGQTYYIRAFKSGGPVEAVPLEIGEKEVADCRLLEGRQPALEGKMSKTDISAFTPEEILLLKRSGLSDEKILDMQKKGERLPLPKINLFDWNEDGKKDIITGSDSGKVYVYLNKGTNQQPEFDMANEISNVKVEENEKSDPYIVDWNDDGKKDILVGQKGGEVFIFINRGTNKEPLFMEGVELNGGKLDAGSNSSPTMVDWNGDGKKDLVVGNKGGNVLVFINFVNNKWPIFQTDGIETNIKVSGYARPFIVDWNNDGKFDVVSGSSDGKVYIFINEGDSKNPKFSKPQMLQANNKEVALPGPTSVIALDWDDDGKIDLLVANKGKVVVYLLLNTGTKEKPEFKEMRPIKGNFRDDAAL